MNCKRYYNSEPLLLIEVYNPMKGNGRLEISKSLMLEMSSFELGVGFQCMFVGFPIDGIGAVIITNTDTGYKSR